LALLFDLLIFEYVAGCRSLSVEITEYWNQARTYCWW